MTSRIFELPDDILLQITTDIPNQLPRYKGEGFEPSRPLFEKE